MLLQGEQGLLEALNNQVNANKAVDDQEKVVKLMQVEVLFNMNEVMCKGYGNNKKQAERNASLNGLKWLRKHKLLGDYDVSCSGKAVNQHFGGLQSMIMEEESKNNPYKQ